MIEFQHVSFSYPGQRNGSLHDISQSIADGECVLLCGRSGCGKTTITRLVNGLIPHFHSGDMSGRVMINGLQVKDQPMYQLAEKVGSLFQNPRTQFFNVDTDSEIAFGIENESLPPEMLLTRVQQTIANLQLEHLQGRNIFELSGGEKQKIAFASIYAMNPDIYLLDEPSSNLDVKAIEELKEHLRLIKAQGKTILIAEHRLYYLMDIVDRILYMEQGRIVKEYTPDEFRALSDQQRKGMGLRSIDLNRITLNHAVLCEHTPVLALRDVSLSYKKKKVLEHLDLRAASGEIIAVIGHNGAGKTTLSRALCGLHQQDSGTFLWKDHIQNHKKRLKLSYMVMQDVNYELFAESVKAECGFGIRHPEKELIELTMEELNLTSFSDHHPNTLSGGQKQRVAVAVSRICGKKLLVFDEPTSGLDYDSMNRVADLIRKLSALGNIIFVVTHDYEFVTSSCTRVLHVDQGALLNDLAVDTVHLETLKRLFLISQKKGDRV